MKVKEATLSFSSWNLKGHEAALKLTQVLWRRFTEHWLGANCWGSLRGKTDTVPALEELPVGQGREHPTDHCPTSLQHSFLSILQSTGIALPHGVHSPPASLPP